MQDCTFFKYGILSFLYESNTIDEKKNHTFKGFNYKSCEFYCKYIKFMIIKVLTATASNSSCYVYVKQTFDV